MKTTKVAEKEIRELDSVEHEGEKENHDYCPECGACFTCDNEKSEKRKQEIEKAIDEWGQENKSDTINKLTVEALKDKIF